MKMRNAGQVQRIGFAALVSSLVFLACGVAMASDVEQRIPVIRDTAGSGLTMEISREGSRQTVTPSITLNEPTVQRVEDRIAKIAAGLATKEIPSGTPREDSGQAGTALSSRPPVPEEITFRSVKSFLKEVRASRQERPAPAVAVPVPEQRLGMADTSRH